MRAVTVSRPGGPETLTVAEVPDPVPGPGEVLVEVAAAGLNKADALQRQGHYPPPPGASELLGMECSGRIAALGDGVTGWHVGDEVCALLAGGGYAELATVDAGSVLPVPSGVSVVDAAALPEVACTVWSNVFQLARLVGGETFLVHGGAGGIGTFAIQLARALGVTVHTTARGHKHEALRELGATVTIDYREQDFVEVVREATGGRGVDVILDNMGASYLSRNIDALAPNGRLAIIGMQGGRTAELDLPKVMAHRGVISVTSLRPRPRAEKAEIVTGVREHVWPRVAAGAIRPIVDRRLPLAEAAEAHRVLDNSDHIGKILLTTG